MASSTQFKQQCPSCEAMVPIKDSSLVGKKVECPKCKYRFVVEDPGDTSSGEEAASDTKTKIKTSPDAGRLKSGGKGKSKHDSDGPRFKKKKEAKKGAPVMLIAGIGLGLVAVVGLVVGAILLFGGDPETKSNTSPGPQANNSPPRPATPVAGGPSSPGTQPPVAGGNSGRLPMRAPARVIYPTDRRPRSATYCPTRRSRFTP